MPETNPLPPRRRGPRAASTADSAAATSGRRRSNAIGSPIPSTSGGGGSGCGTRRSAASASVGAHEHADPIDRGRLRGDERGNRRPCRFSKQRDRPVHIQLRASTRGQQLLGQLGGALLVGDTVTRDREARLRAPGHPVGEHDLGGHRNQRETAKRALAGEVLARRGDGGIERRRCRLPTRVDAGIEEMASNTAGATWVRRRSNPALAPPSGRLACWPEPCPREPDECGRLAHIRLRASACSTSAVMRGVPNVVHHASTGSVDTESAGVHRAVERGGAVSSESARCPSPLQAEAAATARPSSQTRAAGHEPTSPPGEATEIGGRAVSPPPAAWGLVNRRRPSARRRQTT